MINPICVALDYTSLDDAWFMAKRLDNVVGYFKIGMQLYYSPKGRLAYEWIADRGTPVFLDLKLHDTPKTVETAMRQLVNQYPCPAIVNVHASGGEAMMKAARQAAGGRTKVIAVTVLTSLNFTDLSGIGYSLSLTEVALATHMATRAQACGLDGVVCSAAAVENIKHHCGKDFLTVVPGIRNFPSDADDQKQIATPAQAIENGADIIVIGRDITSAKDPIKAVENILDVLPLSNYQNAG